jgi:cholinesterase
LHASELPILFDNIPTGSGIPPNTPAEIAIGSYLRGAWATFAKDPVNGLKTYSGGNGTGWPTYRPRGDTLIRLAFANQTGPNLALGNSYDGECSSTFAIPANATVTSNGTGIGSATPTPVGTSGGRRDGVTFLLVVGVAVIFAL